MRGTNFPKKSSVSPTSLVPRIKTSISMFGDKLLTNYNFSCRHWRQMAAKFMTTTRFLAVHCCHAHPHPPRIVKFDKNGPIFQIFSLPPPGLRPRPRHGRGGGGSPPHPHTHPWACVHNYVSIQSSDCIYQSATIM